MFWKKANVVYYLNVLNATLRRHAFVPHVLSLTVAAAKVV